MDAMFVSLMGMDINKETHISQLSQGCELWKEQIKQNMNMFKHSEIKKLYKKYAFGNIGVLYAEELLDFLLKEQGMTKLTVDDSSKLIQDFEETPLKENGCMTIVGFYNMLLSPQFNIYNHEHRETIHMYMNQPLAQYYISSSHNTYLTGHQLYGESSVDGYISALKRGCKLVELDLWDGDDGKPIIYHGHTFTTKITLEEVLTNAIKPYAFHTSPYPLILSIENHLSIDQQRTMVKLFQDILGDKLETDSLPKNNKYLPSPAELKNKVIIKTKKPALEEFQLENKFTKNPIKKRRPSYCNCFNKSQRQLSNPESLILSPLISHVEHDEKCDASHPLAPELRHVVNVCTGKSFTSFLSSFKEDDCVHFPSLREKKAKQLATENPDDFIKFTHCQIAKIYPNGRRTDSSNIKPYTFWAVGAQVVSLNMQTVDKSNFYNQSLFASNGNCGYVLKPDILRRKMPFSPTHIDDM